MDGPRKKSSVFTNYSIRFFILALVWIFSGVGCHALAVTKSDKILFQGRQRTYTIYLPSDYDSNGSVSLPLVMMFHGGFRNSELAMELTGLNTVAEKNKFIVVYPNGISRRFGRFKNHGTWNAGNCCGYAQKKQTDDVGFVNKLLDELLSKYKIDKNRVYATGISNGAMLCYRLYCQMSDRIAAIAPVAGSLEMPYCNPRHPMPVINFHGTNDTHVPFQGGMGKETRSGTSYRSVPETMHILTKLNKCNAPPKRTKIAYDVEQKSWECNGNPVVLNTIIGGGHMWPGGVNNSRESDIYGGSVSASELIWRFFAQYSLEEKNSSGGQ